MKDSPSSNKKSNKSTWFFGLQIISVLSIILVFLADLLDLGIKYNELIEYFQQEDTIVLQIEGNSADTEYLIKNKVDSLKNNKIFNYEISSIKIISLDKLQAEYSRIIYSNYHKKVPLIAHAIDRVKDGYPIQTVTYYIDKTHLIDAIQPSGGFSFSLKNPFEFKFSYPQELDSKEFLCEVFFENKQNIPCAVRGTPNVDDNIQTVWVSWFMLPLIGFIVFLISIMLWGHFKKVQLPKPPKEL